MPTNQKDIESLLETILALETINESKNFFRDLLTESEIAEFTNRWKAAQMLDAKIPYTTIVEETGLSSTTIARISKWLSGDLGGYRKAITKKKQTNQIHHHPSPLPGKGLV